MARLTGGRAVVEALRAQGVDCLFGIPGVHNLAIYDALYDASDIRQVVARHEQWAGFEADGYARSTGRPGVFVTTTGPGATNAFTALGEAYSDSSPILHIASQIDSPYLDADKGFVHETRDQAQLFRTVTAWQHTIGSVAEVGPAVGALADAVGAEVPEPFRPESWAAWLEERRRQRKGELRRAFVLIWRRPWMTLAGDTYGSSLLQLLGCCNVFAGGGVRYPTVELDEAAVRHPDLVLLPTEPYPFKERHVPDVASAIPGAEVLLVDGQDLFWWGIRTPGAVDRLAQALGLRG